MGKPTGFMDFERQNSTTIAPEERIKNFDEFHIPLSREWSADTGRPLYGLRRTVLPVRADDRRHGFRLSAEQSDSRMERFDLQRKLGAGVKTA